VPTLTVGAALVVVMAAMVVVVAGRLLLVLVLVLVLLLLWRPRAMKATPYRHHRRCPPHQPTPRLAAVPVAQWWVLVPLPVDSSSSSSSSSNSNRWVAWRRRPCRAWWVSGRSV
jgi:hypothetical protein